MSHLQPGLPPALMRAQKPPAPRTQLRPGRGSLMPGEGSPNHLQRRAVSLKVPEGYRVAASFLGLKMRRDGERIEF